MTARRPSRASRGSAANTAAKQAEPEPQTTEGQTDAEPQTNGDAAGELQDAAGELKEAAGELKEASSDLEDALQKSLNEAKERQSAHGRTTTGDNGHGHKNGNGDDAGKSGPEKRAGDKAGGEPEAEKPEKPKGEITVETVQVPYFRPTVTLEDGTKLVCQHRYLHENEKAAMACGRKMIATGQAAVSGAAAAA